MKEVRRIRIKGRVSSQEWAIHHARKHYDTTIRGIKGELGIFVTEVHAHEINKMRRKSKRLS